MKDPLRFGLALGRAPGGVEVPELTIFEGNRVRILTRGAEHRGRLAVMDYLGTSRGNPPAFTRHEFEEIFCVLSGTLAFQYLGEPHFMARAGAVINVDGMRPHTFWNPDAAPLHALVIAAPAGLDDFFEQSAAVLARRSSGSMDAAAAATELSRIRTRHGIEEVAPPPAIP